MKTRPIPVLITAFVYILAGSVGLLYHGNEYAGQGFVQHELIWVLLIRVLAIICGIFLLKGANWARWLAIAWMAYHVVLSLFHSLSEAVTHLIILAIVAFLLFLPKSSAYFKRNGGHSIRKQK